jgi:UDP-N-acetyl-D-glucosamine dehydrogenase
MPANNRRLAIIGQGYVGLPLAMAATDAGWQVIGVDVSDDRVAALNAGQSPVEDVTDQRLQAALAASLYRATNDFPQISSADVITICVPTPLDPNRNPDLVPLISAAQSIEPHVKSGALVVSESTSYPGTLRNEILPIFQNGLGISDRKVYFASAPERVNPGDQKWNQKNTPRLVGGIDEESQKIALDFYTSICDSVVPVSSPEIAEAGKLLENTFRLVNIALINEFTQLCSAQGIDVHQVIDAAATKPYGFMPFRPGVGVGGHCIPIDPLYLTWWANQNGQSAKIVELADQISTSMPVYVAERALALVPQKKSGIKVLLLGVAYKAGVGDVRETPASALRSALLSQGCIVEWVDPLVSKWANSSPVDISWECDVAVLVTNQAGMDIQTISDRGVPILDCTNSHSGLKGVTLL